MVKKAVKRKKRKDPYHLEGVISNVNEEINVLQGRLERGVVPESQISSVENRVCTLMNQTLPNTERRLKEALKRQV